MANKPFYESGRYACKVTDQAMGEASTGNPQFVLRFKVMGLVDPSDPTRFIPAQQQYERTFYRTITEKTIEYFVEDLKTLGFSGDSFKKLDPNTDGFHDFRGADVDMWCAHEDDTSGGSREKWSVARQAGSFEVKPLESKKLRELDNLFGKHLKGLKSEAPRQVEPQPAAVMASAEGITDDDIPF